jgi:hypothetical protein
MTGTDWISWHSAYADPGSELSRRLVVVRQRIGEALDRHGTAPLRVLSLCAGDGRDVLAELRQRPGIDATAVLVELDPRLAATAREGAAGLSGVEVRRGDAGTWATFSDAIPADLLMLCGIFGNISHVDIRATIDAVPSMVAPGGTVIWTRGWFANDEMRPTIRTWFAEAGLEEVSFDHEPKGYDVGVARSTVAPVDRGSPERLFTFIR